jgi:hypothetical protein
MSWQISRSERGWSLRPRASIFIGESTMTRIAISADGSILATATFESVDLWDAETGTQIKRLAHDSPGNGVELLAFVGDTTTVAWGDRSGTLTRYDCAACRKPSALWRDARGYLKAAGLDVE